MKNLYISLVILAMSTSTVAQNWILTNTVWTYDQLYSVSFFNENKGYVFGYDQGDPFTDCLVVKTTDGGSNWTKLSVSGTTKGLYGSCCIDSTTWYAVGEKGTIIKTSNNLQWSTRFSGTTQDLKSVYFVNKDTGYVVGNKGTILKTTSAGYPWTSLSAGTTTDFTGVWFTDGNTGYIVGMSDTIFKTTNGGSSWMPLITVTSSLEKDICFTDASTGFMVCHDGIILKTVNAGNTWTNMVSGIPYGLKKVNFPTADTGYILAYMHTMLATTDAGVTWENHYIDEQYVMKAIDFPKANTGYAVDIGGLIYKTINGGGVGVNEKTFLSSHVIVYPNPTKDNFTIESTEGQSGYHLSIYNASGVQLVNRHIKEKKSTVDIANFPLGVYFLRLESDLAVEVKKIVKD